MNAALPAGREMNPADLIDTYRNAFLKFVADGMSYAEAYDQFDPLRLQDAVNAELRRGDSIQTFDIKALRVENACGHETLFDLCVKASFEKRNQTDFDEQALPLMLAGWTMEIPDSHKHNSSDFWRQGQVMSLYWRAPSKRKGKPGRFYRSTNQAFNAMTKANANPATP
jgi:hypothetical protein